MGEPKKGLTLDEIRATPEFQRLTEKQQLFVATYIESGFDRVMAVLTAYNVKGGDRARAQRMSYPLTQNPRIIHVLHMYFGSSPTDEFLEEISRAISNKRLTHAQVEAMVLKSRVLGLSTEFQKYFPSQRKQKEEATEKHEKKERKRAKKIAQQTPPLQGDEWV